MRRISEEAFLSNFLRENIRSVVKVRILPSLTAEQSHLTEKLGKRTRKTSKAGTAVAVGIVLSCLAACRILS